MILTGTAYRPFYPQDSLNWVSSLTPIAIENECNFYISGSGKELIYTLKNNKIYSSNNELISTYNNNELINFSGNISPTSFDLYKDNLPLFLGKQRNYTGDLNGFVFELNDNSSINLESVSILGNQPEYFVDNNIIYQSGITIPINISHSGDYNIFIYSGVSNNDNFTISGADNLVIPPNNTSTIYLINNTNFIPSQQILSIDLYTNIGLENIFINISGEPVIPSSLFYINLTPPINGVFAGSSLNYVLSFANQSGSNIEISLEYISGVTGDYYKKVGYTRNITGVPISGFVSGAGFIINTGTGLLSGYNNLKSAFEYGTGSGLFGAYKLAEDKQVTGFYSTLGSGRGNVNFITNIQGTGQAENIIYSGYITYQGGILTGTTGNLFGSGIIANELQFGDMQDATSTLFQTWTGNIFATFNPDEYETIPLVSPVRFVTGTFRTEIKDILGFAYATGGRHSGKLQGNFGSEDFEPGVYWFSKPFAGPVTGTIVEYTGLNPVKVGINGTITTGFISTTIYQYVLAQGCQINLDFELTGTGIPDTIRKVNDTGLIFPVEIFNTLPVQTGIEWKYENSDFQINSGTVSLYPNYPTGGRTRISRLGETPSGTGIFNNLFQVPFFTGIPGENSSFIGWKESIPSVENTTQVDGKPTDLVYFSGRMGIFGNDDYTISSFTITGEPFRRYSDIGFRFDNTQTGKLIISEFYQTDYISGRIFSGVGIPNGEMFPVFYDSGDLNILSGSISGTFTNISGQVVKNPPTNVIINDLGTRITRLIATRSGAYFIKTFGGEELGQKYFDTRDLVFETGHYFVKNTFVDVDPLGVTAGLAFSHINYIACEKDHLAIFKIQKTGDYKEFEIEGQILGKFTGPNYPIVSQDTLSRGLTWNFSMGVNDLEKCFCIPIYQNTQYNVDWDMDLQLSVDTKSLKYYDPLYAITTFNLENVESTIKVRDDDKEECVECGDGICQATIQDCDCQQPSCFGSRCGDSECLDPDLCITPPLEPIDSIPNPPGGGGDGGDGDDGGDGGGGDEEGEEGVGAIGDPGGLDGLSSGPQADLTCYAVCEDPFQVTLDFSDEVLCYGGKCGSSGYRVPVRICAKTKCDNARFEVKWGIVGEPFTQVAKITGNGCKEYTFSTRCRKPEEVIQAFGEASATLYCKDEEGRIDRYRGKKVAEVISTNPNTNGYCCDECCKCATNGQGFDDQSCEGKCGPDQECVSYRQVDCACCKKQCYYCKDKPPSPMAALTSEDLNFILEILNE